MGADHDHSHDHAHDARILWIVFALNFSMFGLEIWQGTKADATSLLADAMDFLSDSFSYLVTLHVLTKPLRTRAKASILKANLMLLLAALAGVQGVHNLMNDAVPDAYTMGWVGLLALMANMSSAALLYGSRDKDSNMRSVWLCSRNDAVANILIILAGITVFYSGSLWPDLIVAIGIMWLEGGSALKILKHAREEMQ